MLIEKPYYKNPNKPMTPDFLGNRVIDFNIDEILVVNCDDNKFTIDSMEIIRHNENKITSIYSGELFVEKVTVFLLVDHSNKTIIYFPTVGIENPIILFFEISIYTYFTVIDNITKSDDNYLDTCELKKFIDKKYKDYDIVYCGLVKKAQK